MNSTLQTKGGILLEETGKIAYYVALTAFSIIIVFNQLDYVSYGYHPLILIDTLSMLLSWGAFFLYRKGLVSFRLGSGVLVYVTFTDLFLSLYYFYFHSVSFTGNVLLYIPVFCANIMVVGFCNGRRHAFIAGIYFILAFTGLLFLSRDPFLMKNAVIIIVPVLGFSWGITGLLYVFGKVHAAEISIRQELHEKETRFIKEHADYLNLQLDSKQRELTTKAMYQLKLVEKNNAFISELRDMQKNMDSAGIAKFNSLLEEYSIIHMENYWKEFETCFQEVHLEFYRKLQEGYPHLTPAERRLAAFIRLDLSSKQIAEITQTTAESVHVARSRLRKKIGLDKGENMTIFFGRL
ncbi:MAG: helix-turn-helix transcriptional regulator [Bacteroidota bacterium]